MYDYPIQTCKAFIRASTAPPLRDWHIGNGVVLVITDGKVSSAAALPKPVKVSLSLPKQDPKAQTAAQEPIDPSDVNTSLPSSALVTHELAISYVVQNKTEPQNSGKSWLNNIQALVPTRSLYNAF